MKSLVTLAAAIIGFAAFTTGAQALECPFAKPRHNYHRPVTPTCPPKKVVQTAAPETVVEKPAEHVTVIKEKIVVEHEVVEMPTRVVVVPPPPRCCAAPAIAPRLSCCPPGSTDPRLRGLPPCSQGRYNQASRDGGLTQASVSPELTPHGSNPQCTGQPKNVWFKCTSPSSGREVNCICE